MGRLSERRTMLSTLVLPYIFTFSETNTDGLGRDGVECPQKLRGRVCGREACMTMTPSSEGLRLALAWTLDVRVENVGAILDPPRSADGRARAARRRWSVPGTRR